MNTNTLIIILTVIDVMISLLLIAVILVQQSKDGGFGGAAFGGAGEAVFGGQAGDHLSKFTVILATLFFVVTLSLAIVTGRRTGGDVSVVDADPAATEMSVPADAKKDLKKESAEEEIETIAGDKKDEKTLSIPTTTKKIAVPIPVKKVKKTTTNPKLPKDKK
jgi:preprotein translocase subunit SecG